MDGHSMNNFPNNDQNKQRSVDGFIPSTPRIGQPSTHLPTHSDGFQSQSLSNTPRVDGFSGQQRLDTLPSLQPYSPHFKPVAIEAPPKVKKKRNKKKIVLRTSAADFSWASSGWPLEMS